VSEPDRPDPDALLASIQQSEAQLRRGRLKIFFGMAPGVGKTYAMLVAARKEHHAGGNVLVGLVETHGREETQQLLDGLTVLPRKTVEYRGTRLEEFDLEAALARRPAVLEPFDATEGRASFDAAFGGRWAA
jgi:two-component system sensor histidine kinase KdpD